MTLVNPRREAVTKAAKRHGIPLWVLAGVWGAETDMGSNVKTSSADAQGDFQFIPRTAERYHYPLTNSPTDEQFAQQADAAASYLGDLYHQTGSWEKALRAYSGGGYGEKHVHDRFLQGWWGQSKLSTGIKDKVDPTIKPIGDPLKSLVQFLDKLTAPRTWLRIAEGIAALLIGYFALRQLGTAATQGNG